MHKKSRIIFLGFAILSLIVFSFTFNNLKLKLELSFFPTDPFPQDENNTYDPLLGKVGSYDFISALDPDDEYFKKMKKKDYLNSFLKVQSSQKIDNKFKKSTRPLYPYPTIQHYRHTYGNCKNSTKYIIPKYSDVTVGEGINFTRLWPEYPDKRLEFVNEVMRWHSVLVRMLIIFVAVMEKHNLTGWFICFGTLIGAMRQGGIVPWDTDIDIAITRKNFTAFRQVWRKEFPRDMFLYSYSNNEEEDYFMWNDMPHSRFTDRYSGTLTDWGNFSAFVDLFIIDDDDSKKNTTLLGGKAFNFTDFFPTKTVCFENVLLRGPKNSLLFLEKTYGKKWNKILNPDFGFHGFTPRSSTASLFKLYWQLDWTKDHPNTNPAKVQKYDAYAKNSGAILFPRSDP